MNNSFDPLAIQQTIEAPLRLTIVRKQKRDYELPTVPSMGKDLETSPTAAEVQSLLKQSGYYPGEVDGIVGDLTKEGIKQFESANGLDITGELTVNLMDKIKLTLTKK